MTAAEYEEAVSRANGQGKKKDPTEDSLDLSQVKTADDVLRFLEILEILRTPPFKETGLSDFLTAAGWYYVSGALLDLFEKGKVEGVKNQNELEAQFTRLRALLKEACQQKEIAAKPKRTPTASNRYAMVG